MTAEIYNAVRDLAYADFKKGADVTQVDNEHLRILLWYAHSLDEELVKLSAKLQKAETHLAEMRALDNKIFVAWETANPTLEKPKGGLASIVPWLLDREKAHAAESKKLSAEIKQWKRQAKDAVANANERLEQLRATKQLIEKFHALWQEAETA